MGRPPKTAQLRIIGGQWRSRRLPILADTGVRPTTDRIRETLFNWLQGTIAGARCLDLFAGSGALGFEALSRGASYVTLIDEDLRVVQQLQQNALDLHTDQAEVIWQRADEFLLGTARAGSPASRHPYDIVFLDPPFRDDLLGYCCAQLERCGWLADTALIYVESDSRREFPELLPHWQVIQDKKAGQVAYRLLRRDVSASQ
jgi:16S rRNA (guanine966-N2)-methyltransferase